MPIPTWRTKRPLCVLLLTYAGCAVSAVQNDDSLLDDAGVSGPSANLLPDVGRDVADATFTSEPDGGGLAADAGALYTLDAAASDGGSAAPLDAATADSGAHDAGSTADSGHSDASTDAATSCVPDVCTAKCGIFKGCCNSSNVCACEDLLGLCILPAT